MQFNWLFKFVLNVVSRGRLSILIYHRVLESPDSLVKDNIDSKTFDWQIELISKYFNVLSVANAVNLLKENKLPPRSLCITFDDGYSDNIEVALPILKKHGVTATFFITTGFLDGGRMWNDTVIESIRNIPYGLLDLSDLGLGRYELSTDLDKLECINSIINSIKHISSDRRQLIADALESKSPHNLPDNLMMTSDQVRGLHQAGMDIGGHTVSHPILAVVNDKLAKEEIAKGKEKLEEIVGEKITVFAYPNGKPGSDYLPEHVDLVRSLGFESAVSTTPGVSCNNTSVYELRRFTPWDNVPQRFLARLLRNYLNPK